MSTKSTAQMNVRFARSNVPEPASRPLSSARGMLTTWSIVLALGTGKNLLPLNRFGDESDASRSVEPRGLPQALGRSRVIISVPLLSPHARTKPSPFEQDLSPAVETPTGRRLRLA